MRIYLWERKTLTALVAGTLFLSGLACASDPDEAANDNEVNASTNAGGDTNNDGGSTDGNQDLVEALCDETTSLTENITSATTLTPDCYQVDRTISVNAKLTIEPGTVLRFANDTGLFVTDTGSIVAKGTSSKKILFTSQTGTTNSWQGIAILSNSPDNAFDHVILEHTGRTDYLFNRDNPSGLILRERGEMHLTNSIFRDNAGPGIRINSGDGKFATFENNSFTGNAGAPIELSAAHLGQLGEGNFYETAEEKDFISVRAGTISSSTTWSNQGIPYRFSGEPTISNGTVTIAPGTTLEFLSGHGLSVVEEGTLRAIGEEGNEILFTSTIANSDSWRGIAFNTASQDNALENVVVENAGQKNYLFNRDTPGNLVLRGSSGVTVKNSTIRNAAGTGIHILNSNATLVVSDTHFEDNSEDAIQLLANQVADIGPGNTFDSGTQVNIAGGTINRDASWRALDVPYYVTAEINVTDNILTIEPGSEFQFRTATGLGVTGSGALIAEGTATDSILFTSSIGTPGTWRGLVFNTDNPISSLAQVTVENAGQKDYLFNGDIPGNVILRGSSTLTLTNSNLNNSSGYGLFKANNATIKDENDNALDDEAALIGAGNSFAGNADGAINF